MAEPYRPINSYADLILSADDPRLKDPLSDEERTMVNDCIARARKLEPRDAAFIDNIRTQAHPLTSPQRQWLDDLWDRIT